MSKFSYDQQSSAAQLELCGFCLSAYQFVEDTPSFCFEVLTFHQYILASEE